MPELEIRMNAMARSRHSLTPIPFLVAAAGLLVACAQPHGSASAGAAATRMLSSESSATTRSESDNRARRAVSNFAARNDAPVAALLDELGDEAKAYHAHVTTLSNPFFEGRAPGSEGMEVAGDYIEHYFKVFGLDSAFSSGGESSYRQAFTVPGPVIVEEAEFAWNTSNSKGVLTSESDFDPTPFSSSGEASGEIVFLGYGIEAGSNGYTSFESDPDLTGKIALILRFEPMSAEGKSLWATEGRWSSAAGLLPKIRAAVSRGAAGVILVNPPGADDPRITDLLTVRGSRFGGTGEAPVVMVSMDAAETMLAAAGDRTLMDLRRRADRGSHGAVPVHGLAASFSVAITSEPIQAINIGGVLPGKGGLRSEYVVIGAHYDHVGFGAYGTRSPGQLHPGADDNASGTAGVLLAAEKLTDFYKQLPDEVEARSILFVTFSAEEMGLLGSKHFAENSPVALSQIDAMLNMDMIGRLRGGAIEVLGVGTGAGFEPILTDLAEPAGLNVTLSRLPGGRSDHASFSDEGVPAIAFFTGLHDDYHAPTDTGSKISHKGAVKVVDYVSAVAVELATQPGRITFVSQQPAQTVETPRVNVSVRLGIAPGNYADEKPGVLIGSVSEGTSADKAGLHAGDRIIRWNGEELLDVQGMMTQLAITKPGDVVRMIVIRNEQELPVDVTFQAREGVN